MKNLSSILLVATLILFIGCGDTAAPSKQVTETISAKISAKKLEIKPEESVLLSAEKSILPNNTTVTYRWIDNAGTILGTASTLEWKAPATVGRYSVTLYVNYLKRNQNITSITMRVKYDPVTQNPTFSSIKNLVKASKNGDFTDVHYICLGDSTRTFTNFEGSINHSEHIFEQISSTLTPLHLTTHLEAQGGLSFKTYRGGHYVANDPITWIQMQNTLALIPGDGEHTILDISLGANDFSRLNEITPSALNTVKGELKKEMITTIYDFWDAKPKLKIMLSAPNPLKDWVHGSAVYHDIYKEVAQQLRLPFANFVDDIMPAHGSAGFNAWYNDNIHFKDTNITNPSVGMYAVSQFVLGKMLPAN